MDETMKRDEVYFAYAQSLFWAALLITIVVGVAVLGPILSDFIARKWPVRADLQALVLGPMFFGSIAIVGSFLVLTLPQSFEAVLANGLARRYGRVGQLGVALVLPLTAGLTWFCYDYLTPTLPPLAIGSENWTPFQHGITFQRYLGALVFQTPVTLFSIWYCDAVICRASRETVVAVGLIVAVVVGIVLGSYIAFSDLTGRPLWPY